MKRFHVHVAVRNLDDGIRFYSTLFGAPPSVRKPDYAKWMVEDPRINFAISARGGEPGVNHLGFQLDSDEAFRAMHAQLAAADAGLVEETGAHCCYAESDKYWVTDPAGIAWETYHTLGSIPMFGGDEPAACCATGATVDDAARRAEPATAAAGCCAPKAAPAAACGTAGDDAGARPAVPAAAARSCCR